MENLNRSMRVVNLALIFLLFSSILFNEVLVLQAEEWYLEVYYKGSMVNGYTLDLGNPEIRVGPGERISGFIEVVIDNNKGGPWITPVIGTASWTREEFECIARNVGKGVSTHWYQFELTAPIVPGTYYLGVFTGWMYSCDEVASNDHPPNFGDGDDVWDMPEKGWEEVITSGQALSGPYRLPGRAIRIIVEEQIGAQHVPPKINLRLVAAYLKESLGTWGIAPIDLESTFYGVEALRLSEGLNLIDVEKTAKWIAAHQREDGSFSHLEDSYFAIITLKTLNRLDLINKESTIKYILKRVFEFCNAFNPSMPCLTAWPNLQDSFHIVEILSALGSLEAISNEIKEIAINRILSWQEENGSWDNNIVLTYYALKTLKAIGGFRSEVLRKTLKFIQTLYDPDTGYYRYSPLDQHPSIDSTFYAVAVLRLLEQTDAIEEKVIQNVIKYFNYDIEGIKLVYVISFILDTTGGFAISLKEHIRSNIIKKYYAFSIGAFRCHSRGWMSDGEFYHHINSLKILLGNEISEYVSKIGALRDRREHFDIFQAEIVLSWTIFGDVPSDMKHHFIESAKKLLSEKGHLSDLELTYFMLESISRLGILNDIVINREKIVEFILSHYDPDSGGFGLPDSSIHSTFLALSALKVLNALDRIERQHVVSYISEHISQNDIHTLYYAVKSLLMLGERLRDSDVVHVIRVIRSYYIPAGYFGNIYRTTRAIELLDLLRPYGVKIEGMKLWFLVSTSTPYGNVVGKYGWIEDGEKVEFYIDKTVIELNENERIAFKKWQLSNQAITNQTNIQFVVSQPLNLSAVWVKQYHVSVESEFGKIIGSGWYDEGANATIYVEDTVVYDSYVEGKRYRFTGWVGDSLGEECKLERFTFKVIQPLKLKANWQTEYKVSLYVYPEELAKEILGNVSEIWISEGETFYYEVPIEIKISGDMKYLFRKWSGDVSGTSTKTSIAINKPTVLIAHYKLQYLTFTFTSQTEGKYVESREDYLQHFQVIILLITILTFSMIVYTVKASRARGAKRIEEINRKMKILESMYREGKISREAYEIVRKELEQEKQKQ